MPSNWRPAACGGPCPRRIAVGSACHQWQADLCDVSGSLPVRGGSIRKGAWLGSSTWVARRPARCPSAATATPVCRLLRQEGLWCGCGERLRPLDGRRQGLGLGYAGARRRQRVRRRHQREHLLAGRAQRQERLARYPAGRIDHGQPAGSRGRHAGSHRVRDHLRLRRHRQQALGHRHWRKDLHHAGRLRRPHRGCAHRARIFCWPRWTRMASSCGSSPASEMAGSGEIERD